MSVVILLVDYSGDMVLSFIRYFVNVHTLFINAINIVAWRLGAVV
jgi:hypothetical protein